MACRSRRHRRRVCTTAMVIRALLGTLHQYAVLYDSVTAVTGQHCTCFADILQQAEVHVALHMASTERNVSTTAMHLQQHCYNH
eukprot:3697-Heterococcus_DN1.PRE.1